ncbi:MAG: hypothetical protein II747_07420 [Clostridia bacterium]|jgi:pilin isopeptide linkage protein|nr:hypothetical protein [Clostridia bacterium]
MKTRKVLAALMAIAMVVMSFGAITAHAEGGWDVTTERNGDVLTFSFAISEDLGIAGGLVYFETDPDYGEFHTYDHDVFTFNWEDVYCMPALLSDLSQYVLQLGTPNGSEYDCHTGDVIFSVSYQIDNSAFEKGKTYAFTFYVPELIDFDGENYPGYAGWMDEGNTDGYITVTYMEPDDTPTPTPTAAPTAEPTAEPTAKPEDVIYVKKTVRSENDYGTETFNFTAECVSVEGNNGQVSPADAPAITIGSITMTYPDTEGTVDLPSLTFPMGGVYTYKITEVNGGTDFWSYDSTEYYIVFEVEPDREGNLVIDRYYIHTGSATGDKADEIEFVNTYAALTDLTITKTVVGGTADDDVNPMADVMFDFSITFDKTFTGKINGEDVTFTSGEPYTFQLGNGDELNIGNIPAGATYTLVETGKEYYTGSAVVVSGDSSNTVDGEYAADLTVTGTAEPTDELGINKVDVTNTYSIPPITGITMHGEMIAIIALALVALVGGFVLSRKLRRSED